jgi:hypothetical protein
LGYDPSATLAVHCGNGFAARFKPYQSTRLSRYNAGRRALKSMDAVCAKLKQAVLYIERNPKLVRSITAFPYIINSL